MSQVDNAMTEMDHLTQENAAAAEELSSSAREMSVQAERLQLLAAGPRQSEITKASAIAPQARRPALRPAIKARNPGAPLRSATSGSPSPHEPENSPAAPSARATPSAR